MTNSSHRASRDLTKRLSRVCFEKKSSRGLSKEGFAVPSSPPDWQAFVLMTIRRCIFSSRFSASLFEHLQTVIGTVNLGLVNSFHSNRAGQDLLSPSHFNTAPPSALSAVSRGQVDGEDCKSSCLSWTCSMLRPPHQHVMVSRLACCQRPGPVPGLAAIQPDTADSSADRPESSP